LEVQFLSQRHANLLLGRRLIIDFRIAPPDIHLQEVLILTFRLGFAVATDVIGGEHSWVMKLLSPVPCTPSSAATGDSFRNALKQAEWLAL